MQADIYFKEHELPVLWSLYNDQTSKLFMQKSTKTLYDGAKEDARLYGISIASILKFKTYVEEISRQKTDKFLKKGEKRYGFRKYRSFAPKQIISGDLCFLDSVEIRRMNKNKFIVLVLMDLFSRVCSLRLQSSAKAVDTLRSFRNSLASDFGVTEPSSKALFRDNFRLFISDRGSEFKSIFLRTLKEDYGIKTYFVRTGVFLKVSPIERLIRSIKSLFFSYTIKFKTLKLENILQLIQQRYNHRIHSSLFGFTPYQVHYDKHAASIVVTKMNRSFRQIQHQSKLIYLKKPYFQKFQIGDMVFLKSKKTPFDKEFSLKQSRPYKISSIDKTFFPYLYRLKGISNMMGDNKPRRFYSHELSKTNFHVLEKDLNLKYNVQAPFKVQVLDAKYDTFSKTLRSGRVIEKPDFDRVLYFVRRGEHSEPEWFERSQLITMQNSLGPNAFQFHEKFREPSYASFSI
jgi:transposase InsO family protein